MNTSSARIVRFHDIGGDLNIENCTIPEPAAGEVRVRVKALGLNRVETLFRKGIYFLQPSFPSNIGMEVSGVVETVGAGVDKSWVGKNISNIPAIEMREYGVAGDVAIVPASVLIETPANLTFNQGAAIWMPYLTAWGIVQQAADMKQGDYVLLAGAGSSIGLAAIQIIKALGGKSIAMTRTVAKKDALLQHGADHVIVTNEEDIPEAVKKITEGRGAQIVVDVVAGKGLEKLAEATADNGTIVMAGYLGTDMFGYADGMPTPYPFLQAVARNLTIRGFNSQIVFRTPELLERAKSLILPALASGVFIPRIDKTFPLEQINEAYTYLESSGQVGKIVVTV